MIKLILTILGMRLLSKNARINKKNINNCGKVLMKISKTIYNVADELCTYLSYINRKYIKKVDIKASNKKVVKLGKYKKLKKRVS